MKILRFKFEDKSSKLRLEELNLNSFNLLVGASGVGKTQILTSISTLKEISSGLSLHGLSWLIEFESISGDTYLWEGEFDKKSYSIFTYNLIPENNTNKSKILYEKVFKNNKLIVDRDKEKIIFNNKETIKLSPEESVLSLLKEEKVINNAYEELKKIHFVDYSNSAKNSQKIGFNLLHQNELLKEYNTLEKIQTSSFYISFKLFLVYKNDKKTFYLIKKRFCDIFPQVEDIKIEPLDNKLHDIPDFLQEIPFIQIKEKNVEHWIDQVRLSSGMFRTLIQLSELYLCQEGSVFLIDEFENSLGINCINEITSDILSSNRKIQFILTSHHPYIIDSIGFENWKLVTRNAGVIKTHNMDKFNIGKSKHSAFMQLLQLEEYQTGQEQE